MHDLVIHYRKDNKYKNYLIKDGSLVDEEYFEYLAICVYEFFNLGGFDEKE